mgnify:CR=1 FL=1
MKAIRNFCGRSDMGFVAIILLVAFAYLSFCYFNFHRERSRIQACEDPTLITTSVSGSWQRGTGSEDIGEMCEVCAFAEECEEELERREEMEEGK